MPGLAAEAIATRAEVGRREVWHSASRDLLERTYTAANIGVAGEVVVTDLTPFVDDRDRCVHVVDASHSGISAEAVTRRPEYVRDSLSMNPDVVLVPLGFNDAGDGRTPEQLRRTLVRLVGMVRSVGYHGPVVLVSWHRPTPGFFRAPWWRYRDAIRAAADAPATTFVDIGASMPPVADARAGTYLGPLHPGLVGQQVIAVGLARVLTVPSAASPGPTTGDGPAAGHASTAARRTG